MKISLIAVAFDAALGPSEEGDIVPPPWLPCQRLLPRNRLPAVAADGICDC